MSLNQSISIYQPYVAKNTLQYVTDCIETNWISSKGAYISRFEDKFCQYTKIKHATAVTNGTVALHLALLALGIKPHDEIIVPTFTYVASVNCIKMVQANPVFIDSFPDNFMLDYTKISQVITPKTKAIIVPHLYGYSCNMDEIMKIAKSYGLFVIEDCAESFGTFYKKVHTGNFGDIATFSFFGNKTITTGEGGMVASNDPLLIAKCAHLKAQGLHSLSPNVKTTEAREYYHDVIGYNYRMTNISAAIGLAQLEDVEIIISRKKQVAANYLRYLDKSVQMLQSDSDVDSSYWMIALLFDNEDILLNIRNALKSAGVETRPFFPPTHSMPMYNSKDNFPIAQDISKRGLNVPSFPMLTEEQIKYICGIINHSL